MNERARTIISMMMALAIAALLAFPFVPAFASPAGASEEKALTSEETVIAGDAAAGEIAAAQGEFEVATRPPENEVPWEVTSLNISKDVDVVTSPGIEISLEKTASESYLEMMVGETKDVTFTIDVGAQFAGSYYIAGNIFVQNTGDWPADVIAVSDTVWYKAGGPSWLPATSNITTTVPMGDNAIPTGGPHVYSYSGTFTLPVPLAGVTAMSNLIEISISNKPDPPKPGMQDWKFHYRQDFAKPAGGGSTQVSLEDIETITPADGLSYQITSVTINGSDAGSLTGPWALDLANAPFTIVIDKELSAEKVGEYTLNNKAKIGDLEDDVDVEIEVKEPDREYGEIHGHKYVDSNGNGELDADEPALAGVTVKLYRYDSMEQAALVSSQFAGLVLVAETITDENGYYHFAGLEPGEYMVEEVVPEGMYATSANPVDVSVEEGEKEEVDFLNARMAGVSGEKLDFSTQEPVAGVKFVLEGEDFYKEAFSGEDGSFDFGWVMPGDYRLYEVVPAGWVAVNESEHEMELENGDEEHFVFLNKRLSAVYGYKWLDANADGIHQEGEPALSGVKIILDGEGINEERMTDGNGYFIFEDLLDGQYMVLEEVPDGYYATGAIEVGVNLEAGEEKRVDFLNAPQAAVLGTKWLDLNASGQFDEGEEGLAGVTIRLLDAEGEAIATTLTAAGGSYAFTGLKAGEYTVEEVVPEGYVATSPVSVSFDLSAGEEKVVDFHNNVQVAGEVITPVAPIAPAQPEAGQTLPVTGFELTWILILIAAAILIGAFVASFGLVRLTR
ncbi:MAG: hypothetical protein C4536_15220 [Actinobacteria bacterium]|jgi:hypothetical protein|nr:MAG: hypothetical protein C4536_15220 [Actinomycetota bacterium]